MKGSSQFVVPALFRQVGVDERVNPTQAKRLKHYVVPVWGLEVVVVPAQKRDAKGDDGQRRGDG